MDLCLFCSYRSDDIIPNYVKFWLESLLKFNDEIILITNERDIIQKDLDFLNIIGVKLLLVKNEGYDFGMFYKGMKSIDINDYNQISLINDSTILFDDLSMVYNKSKNYDYYGIFEAHDIDYHIQSFFLVFRGKAIKLVMDYMDDNGLVLEATIEEIPTLKYNVYGPANWDIRQKIIYLYEIGMSQNMINNKMSIGSFVGSSMNIPDMGKNLNKIMLIKKKYIKRNFVEHELHHYLYTMKIDLDKELDGLVDSITKKLYNSKYNININYILENI